MSAFKKPIASNADEVLTVHLVCVWLGGASVGVGPIAAQPANASTKKKKGIIPFAFTRLVLSVQVKTGYSSCTELV